MAQAGEHFSLSYERPARALSDWQPSVARSTYAALDTGEGWLKPGMNLLYNGLGRMEHLVDPDRYKNQGNGSGGAVIVINNSGVGNMSDEDAKKLVQAINMRARHNGGKTGLIS